MKKHANIPIFIPHLGCPNQCVFCNQRTISGVTQFDPAALSDIIDSSLTTIGEGVETEIAFFGGSFTGIDSALMTELLQIAYSYVESGRVCGIRCSTRPDYINHEVLTVLKKYGVKTIELGLQSIDNEVLKITKRGHSFDDEAKACRMVLDYGFELVGQMMIGLPASTLKTEMETCEFIISSGASGARIYPTVVFKNTELCDMAINNAYIPLSLEDAVTRSAAVIKKFIDAGIDVIRVGLCSSENLASCDTYFAGPNHAALGELVQNEIYYEIIKEKINKLSLHSPNKITVQIPSGALSKATGHKKRNKIRLMKEFLLSDIRFTENGDLTDYCVSVFEERL
ncbi:MAG: radical SAM protein [Ruminococcaceae bacterium]|nr:radical SAM protein [Oscillospiraceae bacterium]